MTMLSRRALNVVGLACCAGLMGFALYAQHVLHLEPCPLCILQRIVVISLGIVFLVAALHDPKGLGRWIYAGLVLLVTATGTGVAGWHWHLQNLPPSEVPACGPGLEYMMQNFPLGDALSMVFKGSGECAEVAWSFLGLSMPAWVVVWMVGLGVAGAWNQLRKQ